MSNPVGDKHYASFRIIRGEFDTIWKFRVGMDISFPVEDIKPLFPEEYEAGMKEYNYEMLSKRARISVLGDGKRKKRCDFDEDYWFNDEYWD